MRPAIEMATSPGSAAAVKQLRRPLAPNWSSAAWGGDVKPMAACGAWLGSSRILAALAAAVGGGFSEATALARAVGGLSAAGAPARNRHPAAIPHALSIDWGAWVSLRRGGVRCGSTGDS